MATDLNLDTQVAEVEKICGIEISWAERVLTLLRNLAHSENNPFGNAATMDNGTAAGQVPLLGTGGVLAVTHLPTASRNASGVVRIATTQEILDGTNPGTAVSPLGLQEKITVLTPLNDTAFIGEPTAPTPPDGDNSTRIATTEFITRKRNNDMPATIIVQHIYQASLTQPAPLTGVEATIPHGWSTTVPEQAPDARQEIWSASRVLRIRESNPLAAADRRKTIEISGHTITVDSEIDISLWSTVSRWTGNAGKNSTVWEWRGEWAPDTDYRSDETVQDVVGRQGQSHICVKSHRSSSTFHGLDYWRLLAQRGPVGADGISFSQHGTWAVGHGHYALQDTVVHNRRSWICKQAHNSDASHTPGTGGGASYWDLLADQGAVGQEGPDQEYIYMRTRDYSRPAIPVASSNAPDALPAGDWVYSAGGVDTTWRYEWRAERRKWNDIWQPFSVPALVGAFPSPDAQGSPFTVSDTALIYWRKNYGPTKSGTWSEAPVRSVTGEWTHPVASTATVTATARDNGPHITTASTGGSITWRIQRSTTHNHSPKGVSPSYTRKSHRTDVIARQTASCLEWRVIVIVEVYQFH